MTGEPDLNRWEGLLEHLVGRGFTDDEIRADFDRTLARDERRQFLMFTRAGDFLDWGSLHDRRRIESLLAEIRHAQTSPASAALVERYARIALKLREPDGTWPTQAAVAEDAGVTDRQVRNVGWKTRILPRAEQLAQTGSSG